MHCQWSLRTPNKDAECFRDSVALELPLLGKCEACPAQCCKPEAGPLVTAVIPVAV